MVVVYTINEGESYRIISYPRVRMIQNKKHSFHRAQMVCGLFDIDNTG